MNKQKAGYSTRMRMFSIAAIAMVVFAAGALLSSSAARREPSLLKSSIVALPAQEVLPGMVQSYSFTITNSGDRRANDVRARANVDPRLEVLRVTDGQFDEGTATAHWRIKRLEPGQSITVSFMGRVKNDAPAGKTIDVRAFVRSNEVKDQEVGALATRIGAIAEGASAKLITFQTVNPKVVQPGGEVQFHIIVHNDGQLPADGIIANEQLPRELELLTDSIHPHLSNFAISETPDLSYDPEQGRLQIKMDRLMPGEWVALMFHARVRENVRVGDEISAQATIEARGPNFKQLAPVQMKIGPQAASVTMMVDKTTAKPGDQLTYTITVTNPDSQEVKKLKITNKIPKELTLVRGSATTSCGLQVVEAGDKGQVLWKKGTLPAAAQGTNGSCTVSFKATVVNSVRNGTNIVNTATVKAPGQSTLTANATTMVMSNASTASVDMMDNFFAPKDISVPPGTIVTWTHRSNNPHTVTGAMCSPIAITSDGQFPNGLTNGQTFSFTVPADARPNTTIYYFCRFHGAGGDCRSTGPGMAGSITVRPN